MLNRPKPLVLLILDGFGYPFKKQYNAIAAAKASCWNKLHKDYPRARLSFFLKGCNSTPFPGEDRIQVYVCGDKPLVASGSLSHLAPAMLEILGIPQPVEMTGRSLLAVL